MVDKAAREAADAGTKEKIAELKSGAIESLQKLDEINRKLKDELERADRLATLSTTLAGVGIRGFREVNTSTGIITTVAGSGTCGYSGDGGLATSAAE
jgi:hypothetical protein